VHTLLPGASVGVIGGGQLGRYFVIAAQRLGYKTWVLDPDAGAPAMQLAEHVVVAQYDDVEALNRLGMACDAVTVEFENVPASSLELLESVTRVAPSAAAVKLAQDRALEKERAALLGLSPVPWARIASSKDVPNVVAELGLPGILKTATLGYDGKGQHVCTTEEELLRALDSVGGAACVLERQIELVAECSVVLARGFDGRCVPFPVAENVHLSGVLHTSTVPSRIDDSIVSLATRQAIQLAEGLEYVGVLGVEFFVDASGTLWFNEMAPRPHNSGHFTLDATASSQFEQQLRAMCALPLGDASLLSPVTMVNVLGDAWLEGSPDWQTVLSVPGANVHLYGKSSPRAGRKMGHVNCVASSRQSSLQRAGRVCTSFPV